MTIPQVVNQRLWFVHCSIRTPPPRPNILRDGPHHPQYPNTHLRDGLYHPSTQHSIPTFAMDSMVEYIPPRRRTQDTNDVVIAHDDSLGYNPPEYLRSRSSPLRTGGCTGWPRTGPSSAQALGSGCLTEPPSRAFHAMPPNTRPFGGAIRGAIPDRSHTPRSLSPQLQLHSIAPPAAISPVAHDLVVNVTVCQIFCTPRPLPFENYIESRAMYVG
ncbi:hypothetical protein FIBSPDRAFT_399810 [Athelia psychrophila]|uniref:Uncharacterized protein n=1 Tax=Athelia psychrophila TaxID=1759441 RepID=A0A166NFL6_9AGAM|nr:hypothetical protein FIBSPDRAFT_399810 [Fibularhizoctonia sp. CBS 109695]